MTEKECCGCKKKFNLEEEEYICPNCQIYASEDDPELKKDLKEKGLI